MSLLKSNFTKRVMKINFDLAIIRVAWVGAIVLMTSPNLVLLTLLGTLREF